MTLQLTDHTALRREKHTQSVTFVVESGGRMGGVRVGREDGGGDAHVHTRASFCARAGSSAVLRTTTFGSSWGPTRPNDRPSR